MRAAGAILSKELTWKFSSTSINFDLHNRRSKLEACRIRVYQFFTTKDIRHCFRMLKIFKCLPYDWKYNRVVKIVDREEGHYLFCG